MMLEIAMEIFSVLFFAMSFLFYRKNRVDEAILMTLIAIFLK